MIYETLQILKEQLDAFFVEAGLGKVIALENVALWDSGNDKASSIEDKVIITLLKLEEENTLRNSPNYTIVNGKTEYKNPPVNLNLYLLISANRDTYDKSLLSISRVMQFFQGKKVFTSVNTVYNRTNVAMDPLDTFKFIVELYSPGFEELNHVWGTLGGRQLPSAIYKIQMAQITQDKKLDVSDVITNVSGNLNTIL